jgi:uncharacterized membrane protein
MKIGWVMKKIIGWLMMVALFVAIPFMALEVQKIGDRQLTLGEIYLALVALLMIIGYAVVSFSLIIAEK